MTTAPAPAASRVCDACGERNARDAVLCARCESPLVSPERRHLTLLFADLTGYTGLGAVLDPEELHLLVRPIVVALRRVAEDYGAVVPGIQGDGFMAIFGAPVTHEDDPRRAVLASVEMQRLVARWQAAHLDQPVPDVHIGVHVGEALVAPAREGLSVTGDPVNVASRLCGVADGREIVVSEVAARTAGLADEAWTSARSEQVRGRPEPVAVRSLDWESMPANGGGRSARSAVSLIDRTEAMSALCALEDPGSGSGRLTVLVGEAGVGKTRIAEEWLATLTDRLILRGHAPAFAAPSWTAPFSEVLWRLARERTGSPTLSPEGALDEIVRAAGALSVGVVRRLGRLVGSEPDSAEVDTDAEQADAFETWLMAVARRRRIVLYLEDVYWAAPGLVGRLQALADAVGPGSVVLASARPETQGLEGLPVVRIEPLEDAYAHELVERLLPGCPADVAGLLVDRSGGNPFFAEEAAQLLLEEGTVRTGSDGTTLVDRDRLTQVPTSMRLFVTARLDLLSPAARRTLGAAAVAGDAVEPALLFHLLPDVDTVAGQEQLIERGLMRRRPPRTASEARRGTRLAFRHALVCDVAYDGLARNDRALLHARAAAWFEALDDRSLDAVVARAQHAETAVTTIVGTPPEPLVAGAFEALVAWADVVQAEQPRVSVEVIDRARELVASSSFSVPGASRALTIQSQAHIALGQHEDALAAATEAVDHATSEEERASALLARGRALVWGWRGEEARQCLAEAEAAFATIGDGVGVVRARTDALRVDVDAGLVGIVPGLIELAGEALRVGDARSYGRLANELAYLTTVIGGETHTTWVDASREAMGTDDIAAQGWLDLAGAYTARFLGDLDASVRAAAQAREVGRSLGLMQIEMPAFVLEAEAYALGGELELSRRLLEEMAPVVAQRPARARLLVQISHALLSSRSGHTAEAAALIGTVRASADQLSLDDVAELDVVEARLALDTGRWQSACAQALAGAMALSAMGAAARVREPGVLAVAGAVAGRLDISRHAVRFAGSDGVSGAVATLWRIQDRLLVGRAVDLSVDGSIPDLAEARALEQENAALATGGDADLFAQAAREWESLGVTALHARALTWAGDEKRAGEILDVLQSPPGLIEQWRAQLDAVRR